MDGNRILACIDWMYFPLGSTFNPKYLPISYVIIGNNSLLNHLLVLSIIQPSEAKNKKLENEHKVLE
jgi:hypothetical protein